MKPNTIEKKVFEKYILKEKIGSGSFGDIYAGNTLTVVRHLHHQSRRNCHQNGKTHMQTPATYL